MPHKFGHALPFVRLLFPPAFPYREHRTDYSLDRVEVTRRICILALHLVLKEIVVKTPVMALYRPVVAYVCTQKRRVCRQAARIQPFFCGIFAC